MLPPLSRSLVRQVDHDAVTQLGIPSLLLMENAARGVCEFVRGLSKVDRILILCGYGNNGGDGLAVARLLAAHGLLPEVFLITGGRALSADAMANLEMLTRSGLTVAIDEEVRLQAALDSTGATDLLIDALLGTGIQGPVRAPFCDVISQINASPARTLSVDIPSGLDCDTGQPHGLCVRAAWTITFVSEKIGFTRSESREWTGDVYVCPIGIPEMWLRQWLELQPFAAARPV